MVTKYHFLVQPSNFFFATCVHSLYFFKTILQKRTRPFQSCTSNIPNNYCRFSRILRTKIWNWYRNAARRKEIWKKSAPLLERFVINSILNPMNFNPTTGRGYLVFWTSSVHVDIWYINWGQVSERTSYDIIFLGR